jgi:hypothetical protein
MRSLPTRRPLNAGRSGEAKRPRRITSVSPASTHAIDRPKCDPIVWLAHADSATCCPSDFLAVLYDAKPQCGSFPGLVAIRRRSRSHRERRPSSTRTMHNRLHSHRYKRHLQRNLRNSSGVKPASRTIPASVCALIGSCRGIVMIRRPSVITTCLP